MPGKATILGLKLADRLRLNGPTRVHHHLGRANFGDDINRWFLRRVTGADFRWGGRSRRHLLGIGSILGKATGESWVWGSGFIEPPRDRMPAPGRILALRGKLSAELLGAHAPHLGDPVGLIDLLVERPAARPGSVGVVPHVTQVAAWRRILGQRADLTVIDPSGDPLEVVRAIAACERVASQSLHGLIVADAYGIPAVWVEPSPGMVGGAFKFRDHFTTQARPREAVSLRDLAGGAGLPWAAASCLGDTGAYLGHLRATALGFVGSGD